MSRCEWNPILHAPAQIPRQKGDCSQDAALSVGSNGRWHLCESCAALPEFKQLRVRVPLKQEKP